MVSSEKILEDYAVEEVRQIVRSNYDLRLGIHDEHGATFISRGRLAICQLTFGYKGHFCRVINWAAMVNEARGRGLLQTNIDDSSPHCTFIAKRPDCVDRVASAAQRCVALSRQLEPPRPIALP